MSISRQIAVRALPALVSLTVYVASATAQTNSLPEHTLKGHAILLGTSTNAVSLLLLCQNVSSQSVAVVVSDLQFDDNRSFRLGLTFGRMVVYVKKPKRPNTPILLEPGQYAGVEIRQQLESDSFNAEDILQGKVRVSLWLRAALPPLPPTERIALHCNIMALATLPKPTSTNSAPSAVDK